MYLYETSWLFLNMYLKHSDILFHSLLPSPLPIAPFPNLPNSFSALSLYSNPLFVNVSRYFMQDCYKFGIPLDTPTPNSRGYHGYTTVKWQFTLGGIWNFTIFVTQNNLYFCPISKIQQSPDIYLFCPNLQKLHIYRLICQFFWCKILSF